VSVSTTALPVAIATRNIDDQSLEPHLAKEASPMKAVVIHAYGGPEQLTLEERPDPTPGAGDVLVRVVATSVNPFDLKLRSGALRDFVPLTFPAILGFDVSGTVAAVGPGVKAFSPGDQVFGQATQTYASLCVVKAAELARIPDEMDTSEVAALPTVTTTGAQLAELAIHGRRSGTLLVTGAVGNVGRSAVFAAKDRGWTVIAGVRKSQIEQARATGADRVVAIDDQKSLESLETLDAVADTVSGLIADKLIGNVKEGGTFASVLQPPGNATAYPDVTIKTMQVKAAPTTLLQMAEAAKAGRLVIPIAQRFTLADAKMAHVAAEKGAVGKLLLLA
jgi:NADPH:quinone reductase-like Zn-dependent oxidoreductase